MKKYLSLRQWTRPNRCVIAFDTPISVDEPQVEGVEGLTHDKPFAWTADPDKIIEKVNRGKQASESIH